MNLKTIYSGVAQFWKDLTGPPDNGMLREQRTDPNQLNGSSPNEPRPAWGARRDDIMQAPGWNTQADPGRAGQGSSFTPHNDVRSGLDGNAFPQAFLRVNKAESTPQHFRAATERLIGPGRHAAGGDPRNLG